MEAIGVVMTIVNSVDHHNKYYPTPSVVHRIDYYERLRHPMVAAEQKPSPL